MNITIKICKDPEEILQIFKLNYNTFVEEIPQHEKNSAEMLVDKFHEKNTYIVATDDKEVIGMICINDKRPFSLDQKLLMLDFFLPPHSTLCEIRLLSVKKDYRGGKVFIKLISFLKNYALEKGYDIAIISGTTRQVSLYEKLGFQKFGPLTGTKDAAFQPMYITLDTLNPVLK